MNDELLSSNGYNEVYCNFCKYEGGVYVVGTDIPVGGYVFTATEKQGSIRIYAQYKEYLSDRPKDILNIHQNETYVSLREAGMVIKVIACSMKKEMSMMEKIELENRKQFSEFRQLLEVSEIPSWKVQNKDETNVDNMCLWSPDAN